MKNLLIILVLLFSFNVFSFGEGRNDYTFPVQLIVAAQSVTSVWTDVGSAVTNTGFKKVYFKIKHTINTSSNTRLRVLYVDGDSDEFSTVSAIETATATPFEPHYFELSVDADADFVLPVDLLPVYGFQLQTQCPGTAGGNAELDEVEYMFVKE